MFSSFVYKWLEVSLDYGISEYDFWNMTIAELTRLIESKKRQHKRENEERAAFDYALADLIGYSISRIYSSSAEYPSFHDAYPSLFTSDAIEEKKQAKKDELSALRFRQFANSFNKKIKEVAKQDE